MFEQIIWLVLSLYDCPGPEITQGTDTSPMYWVYVLACDANFNHKNVFKVGYSGNVEAHICAHLSEKHVLDKSRSFKISVNNLSEALALKSKIKGACVGKNLKCRSSFSGKSDWYQYQALHNVTHTVSDRILQEIDWNTLYKNYATFNYRK